MHRTLSWPRIALAGSALALSAIACDSVLGIEEPSPRPIEANAGAAGEPDDGHGGTASGGGALTGEGGKALTPGGDGPGGSGGEGGSAGDPSLVPSECEPKAVRCAGEAAKTPQLCDDTGHWVQNTSEADADCPLLCDSGRCVECTGDEKRCSVCQEGDAECHPNQPQRCVEGAWTKLTPCENHCSLGSCIRATSCDPQFSAVTTCGTESCCTALPVPGGTFKRDFDGDEFPEDSFPASVSPFVLDKYEVTVGRMRQFVNAYNEMKATLFKDGWGKSAYLPGDEGWRAGTPVPADRDELVAQLNCDENATWSELAHDNLPINCVSFPIAYAFCIWDGGRLPTEAEWNFAAAGGSEQRAYPWATTPGGPAVTNDKANFDTEGPITVGGKPEDAGRWGQLDLAGNVAEWTLDYYASYPDECSDCLNSTPTSGRTFRGGCYASDEYGILVGNRAYLAPSSARPFIGLRCARELR